MVVHHRRRYTEHSGNTLPSPHPSSRNMAPQLRVFQLPGRFWSAWHAVGPGSSALDSCRRPPRVQSCLRAANRIGGPRRILPRPGRDAAPMEGHPQGRRKAQSQARIPPNQLCGNGAIPATAWHAWRTKPPCPNAFLACFTGQCKLLLTRCRPAVAAIPCLEPIFSQLSVAGQP